VTASVEDSPNNSILILIMDRKIAGARRARELRKKQAAATKKIAKSSRGWAVVVFKEQKYTVKQLLHDKTAAEDEAKKRSDKYMDQARYLGTPYAAAFCAPFKSAMPDRDLYPVLKKEKGEYSVLFFESDEARIEALRLSEDNETIKFILAGSAVRLTC